MRISVVIFFLSILNLSAQNEWMNEYNFSYLDDHLTFAQYEVRYHGSNNFVGDTVQGYYSDRLVMTKPSAESLHEIELYLAKKGYCLKVFDTYRPQQAVDHFKEWAENISDTLTKAQFYPEQDKSHLFNLGYISSRSGHSRGSTIDLTLAYLESGVEVDMGSPYDYFGAISHHNASGLNKEQEANRLILKSAMLKFGFRAYSKEWWHYTLNGEPYQDHYFDYVVKPSE